MVSKFDGPIQQWFVGDNTSRLQSAGSSDDGFWRGVVNTNGQFMSCKAAKNHRMDRSDARTGQHRHQSFGNHGHIDDNPITHANAPRSKSTGKVRHLIPERNIGYGGACAGYGAVVNDGNLITTTVFNVSVDGVPARVDFGFCEPFVNVVAPVIKRGCRRLYPVNGLSLL